MLIIPRTKYQSKKQLAQLTYKPYPVVENRDRLIAVILKQFTEKEDTNHDEPRR